MEKVLIGCGESSWAIAAMADGLGPIDVLCNNAGMIRAGPFLEQSPATIQHIIDVDLTGRTALVTGTSRGIGRAIAKRLAGAVAPVAKVFQSPGREPFAAGKFRRQKRERGWRRMRDMDRDIVGQYQLDF